MMAYTGKALQPSVSYTHFNFPFIILISRFHFKIAIVGYRVAGSEYLRIDKLFSPLELVAKNTMLGLKVSTETGTLGKLILAIEDKRVEKTSTLSETNNKIIEMFTLENNCPRRTRR